MAVAAEPRRAAPGSDPRRKGALPVPPRKPAARKPAGRTATTRDARRAAVRSRPAPRPKGHRLPTWADLSNGALPAPFPRRAHFLDAVPSLRFAAWTLVACCGLTLYVGHVYATRATLVELQAARRENLRLHLTHERLQGAYDEMTGPAPVLPRAAALGLEEGIAYAPVIRVEE